MSKDVNKFILEGNVVWEPHSGDMSNGGKWMNFTVETKNEFNGKSYADKIKVVTFSEKVVDNLNQGGVGAGSRIKVEGNIKNSKNKKTGEWEQSCHAYKAELLQSALSTEEEMHDF